MTARINRLMARLGTPVAIAAGALVLRLICGVGFANYDTFYALAWGGQLSRGQTPAYGVPIAPTPHPLIEALGLILSPLSPRTIENLVVALGFLALAGCGWVIYRLGTEWFGRAVGALAVLILLTRGEVLSYGTRAYIDIPYLLLVLSALLVETRRRRAGAPVLILLALAGLLRPEAWAFSGLYWLYLVGWVPRRLRSDQLDYKPPRAPAELAWLAVLGVSAPAIWIASDWLITGHPLWSLTNTRHTAETLDRVSGITNVPEYIPRRIGSILGPPALVGAVLGGVLSLAWLRERARLGAIVGVVAVLVFAAFATVGLPINTRYAFLASAILAVFAGAGVFGWTALKPEDRRRRWWMVGSLVVLVAMIAYLPSQYRSAHRQMQSLARQQRIQNELLGLVGQRAITLRCGPVEVTNHAPIPLLALYLKASPALVPSAQSHPPIASGTYVEPADKEVEEDYILDPHDPPPREVSIPPGFQASKTSRSWLIFEKC
ncbi:MAG: hypothetical protein ACRDK4_12680 [Solirubrobacteraceae bacterium]